MKGVFNSYTDLEQALLECGEYVTQVTGVSMFPMLRYRRDPVLIRSVDGPLNRYDVAVFKMDGKYVIHRVVGIRRDCYVFRGDNRTGGEIVPKQQVLGVVAGFWRVSRDGGATKYVSMENRFYRLYSKLWVALNPVNVKLLGFSQHVCSFVKAGIMRIFAK